MEGEITIAKNITLKGGYPTGGGMQDIANNTTALSANNLGRVITINQNITVSLEGLTIKGGNSSSGGGINNDGTLPLTNSSLNNNRSNSRAGRGGGIYNQGTLTLNNSNITDNSSVTTGGGISNQGTTTLTNSIIYNNTPNDYLNTGTITINNSLIKGEDPAGTGNIDASLTVFDPLFTDAANGDYSLQCNSPLVNAGDTTANSSTIDLAGNARVVGSTIDIGAYEHPLTADNASFNYSSASYNTTGADPTATITGVSGGVFSSTSGLSINATIDLSASTDGTYTISYSTSGNCANKATFEVIVVDNSLSVVGYEIGGFTMYPNPTANLLTISIPVNTVNIYNALGSIVFKTTESSFSVAKLPSGVYIITIETDRGTASKKLIKK